MQSDKEHPEKALPRIVVDAMGSDFGPEQIVGGIRLALETEAHRLSKIFLVGNEAVLKPVLKQNGLSEHPLLEIVHTDQVIDMDEKPMQTLKHKKDASMFKAIDLIKQAEAEAVLSCGNTGSLMAGSTLKLRTIPGVTRPALASVIPTRTHRFILMDVGANPNSTAQNLVHNAILGSHFAKAVLRIERPRVGLLTIGTEEGKGNELVHKAHEILKQLTDIQLNYSGLVEGFDLFAGNVDVVICDGFVGNILLKTCESLFLELKDFLKEQFSKNWLRRLGAFASQGVFKTMREQFSPDKFSGAPLLGLNGWVFKSHGSSKASAIAGGINMCLNCLDVYDLKTVVSDIAYANERINAIEEAHE